MQQMFNTASFIQCVWFIRCFMCIVLLKPYEQALYQLLFTSKKT